MMKSIGKFVKKVVKECLEERAKYDYFYCAYKQEKKGL